MNECLTSIHGQTDPICDHVPVALDKRPVEQREHQAEEARPPVGDGGGGRGRRVLEAAAVGSALSLGQRHLGGQAAAALRGGPGLLPLVEPGLGLGLVGRKVDVDQLQQPLGRVRVVRDAEAQPLVVEPQVGDGAEVVRLPLRQEADLVEERKGRGGGLVDAGNDYELSSNVSLSDSTVLYRAIPLVWWAGEHGLRYN